MLDLHLQYDPNISLRNHMTHGLPDHKITGDMLAGGLMPTTLLEISEKSETFRDAVINHMLTDGRINEPQQQQAIELLAAAVSTCPDDNDTMLRIYSEYLAALSYAWGETEVAKRAVLRNKPEKAGRFLSTVAAALDKRMDHDGFHTLLRSTTSTAPYAWENVESPQLYPTV
jgi:hypothetical protein